MFNPVQGPVGNQSANGGNYQALRRATGQVQHQIRVVEYGYLAPQPDIGVIRKDPLSLSLFVAG